MDIQEVIFVGLPGPTHNYGGLAQDNVASNANRGREANPKEAALQALALMRMLLAMGLPVGVLPPQLRPNLALLRQQFSGSPDEIIRTAAIRGPLLLEQASSSSAMWTANAATVAPSPDTADGLLHVTPANLYTNLHRRIEAADSARVLAAIFGDPAYFRVHLTLPVAPGRNWRDEGAANHMRLAPSHASPGLHVFVYGADGGADDPPTARQTLAASQQVAKRHRLAPQETLFIKQNKEVIRRGVFHNDVIAVGNEYVLLTHANAFACGEEDLARLREAYARLHPGKKLIILSITERELPVAMAVSTYFFNSQLVTRPDGAMALIAPVEVQENALTRALAEKLVTDPHNPIGEVRYVDLRQSMRNGGGPACLRLRVPLSAAQRGSIEARTRVLLSGDAPARLEGWIKQHYPESITSATLADPALYHHARRALSDLAALLRVPVLARDA